MLFSFSLRFTHPDNRTVIESIVKEVRGQFPHFTEGIVNVSPAIKLFMDTLSNTRLFLGFTVSCKRYFRTLCQKEKRKASYATELHTSKYRQRRTRVSVVVNGETWLGLKYN